MKISTTKKAAILATVLSGFVLGSSAEAAKLGVVTASDYVTSHMGTLEGSFIHSDDISAVKSVITGLNRDPAVYNTVDQATGESSIFIRQYTYSTVNLQDSYAFNGQDWSNKVAGNTSDATNAHDVARYKDFVYVASYDEGTIGVAKITDSVISDQTAFTRDLKKDLEIYDDVVFENKNAALHGEGVVVLDGNLYVIANSNPKGGYDPYSPSYLIKYVIKEDGRLSYDGYTTMGKNTDSVTLNVYNNYMLSTAIGGYQYYGAENSNADTSLDVVTLDPVSKRFTDTRAITLPENLLQVRDGKTIPKSEFRSLKVLPNGTAYVMTYNIGRAGKNVDITVYKTTVSNLLSENPQNWEVVVEEKAAPGWFGRLDAEYNTKRLWVQVGNKLDIYTDGASSPKSFGTDSFATNQMYEELYTWDIIHTDVIPEGNLVKVQLGIGEYASDTNPNAVSWKTEGTKIEAVNNNIVTNIANGNSVISLGKDLAGNATADEGNLANNILAGVYAEGLASTVNANNGLQIQVDNNIASPVGIYAGADGSLKVNAAKGDVNILTKTMEGGNTLTNAVWLDPTIVGGESLTINAQATNITMEGGYGGNGVAILKTDRWGENSKESALGGTITIKGDLNIKGVNKETWGIGANPENVLSRFNNAGILVDVNNSKITVDGNVDMDVYGNGVTVNAKNATVNINKGGNITVPTGTDYGYYTLAAYEGTINMNKNAGDNAVKLDGDIFALKGATINLGLSTGDSYLKGIVDNGGTVNLTLKNGATWTNEANNSRYKQDNEDYGNGETSKVTKLTGGTSFDDAGVIIQTANSDLLQIDTLQGSVKINYNSYDGNNYTNIKGGDVVIDKAVSGAQVAMTTSNYKGIDTSKLEEVEKVLNALAGKLYYNEYKTGTNNLKGVALGMNEGLTSSSVFKKADIQFNTTTGQGSITGNITDGDLEAGEGGNIGGGTGGGQVQAGPAFPNVKNHEKPLYDNATFVDPATKGVIDTSEAVSGVTIKNQNNIKAGLCIEEYYYDWTGENNPDLIRIQVESNDSLPVGIYSGGADSWAVLGTPGSQKEISIVTKMDENSTKRTNAIWIEHIVEPDDWMAPVIQTNGIDITMIGGYGGNGIAITKGNDSVELELGGAITIDGDLRIKGTEPNQWGIAHNPEAKDARENSAGIYVDDELAQVLLNGAAFMDICGNGITVDAVGAIVKTGHNIDNNNTAYNPYQGSQILVPQGNDEYKYYSLGAYEGYILFDHNSEWYDPELEATYAYNNAPVGGMIDGDMYIGGQNATVDARFKGSYAYFNGAVVNEGGTANLNLIDGATWTNVSTNGETGVTSHITNFRGNNYKEYSNAKIIQTADSGNILIDKYHGNTTVIYGHDESNPTVFEGGAIMITSAATDSKITMYTNYSDAIKLNNVEAVMNSLAGKLYYYGHATEGNLNAFVKIGEGLTASSIQAELLGAGIIDSYGEVSSELENVGYDKASGTLNGNITFNTNGQGTLGTWFNNDGGDTPGEDDEDDFEVTTNEMDYNKAVAATTVQIGGGPWHRDIGTIISASGDLEKPDVLYKTIVDLENKDITFTDNTISIGSGAAISAIDGGIVEINNPGNITIYENCMGPSAGIFANGGGEVYIDNANGGVVKIITSAGGGYGAESGYGQEGAGIKTMNGLDGVRSKVVITGDVDIVADLNKCNNEALSAVASDIEIGGGTIKAINGAWAAIRAYGEFVSNNAATVNVNVLKDEEGNIIGAGNRKTIIEGDFVTNGGMGTLGYITVGLNGAESHWIGNYGDNRGYGVTKGQEGNVTLYMKDGAKWTGFSDGEMNVTMDGEGTTWYGFNVAERQPDDVGEINGGLNLTLTNGALWKNAITKDQKHKENDAVQDSKVYNFVGNKGFIDMTGEETFFAHNDASHAENSNGVSFKNTSIEYLGKQETGNLKITNYSGNTTVIYRRDDKNITQVLGGTTTIGHAEKGSKITLSTDGYGVLNDNQVVETLDNLAEKLYYTAYVDGERNLKGYVQIAEGLTTSSVGKQVGSIDFSTSTGQGSLNEASLGVTPPADDDNTQGGGNEGGNTGDTTTPEQPEQKPVVEEKFEGGVTADSLTDTSEDSANPYKDLINTDEEGNKVIDFGVLDENKSASEKVDIVKIEATETENNNIVISSNDATKPVIIDMAGKDLAVSGTTTGEDKEAKGISAINGAEVTINNAGNITIKANAENGSASAIHAQGTDADNKATVNINNAETGGTVMLRAEGKGSEPVLNADSHADVNITGKVDITNTNGNIAVSVGEGSTVAIGGGIIGDKAEEGEDSVAIHVNGGKVNINADGDETVVINGKIVLGKAPTMMMMKSARSVVVPTDKTSVALTDENSSLNDDVQYLGTGANEFAIAITDGAQWKGNSTGGVDLNVLLEDGGAWTGYHEDEIGNNTLSMEINSGAIWTNTAKENDATTITELKGSGGYIQMSDKAGTHLNVEKYSGNTTFMYNNAYGKDVASEDIIKGGDVTIKAATAGSNITLHTNSIGTSNTDEVKRVLDALAQKLTYQNSSNSNLTGTVQILEGMTTSSAMRKGEIVFDVNGKGGLDTSKEITNEYTGDYIYGDDETAMMRGAKSAMASTVMMWRSESADLLQRMGDLRMQEAEHGIWAKYYGGKYEMDAQNTNFATSYTAYQLGYDKAVGNGWVVGAAVSYNDGEATYTMGGKGETSVTSLSVYGTKNYDDGRYLGLILKGGQLKNDYEVYNNDGYKLEGDFETFGTSLSAEYGKRIEKANGFYFDPSVELTIGHVQGKGYTATSDLLAAYSKTATMDVEQDDFNSMVGRIGFGVGQKLDKASYYAKLALAHEFAGDFDTTYTAEQTKGTSISFGDTWYELQIGGTAKLNDNSLIYATYERSFGGDVTQKWRLDAGVRVTF